MKNNVDFLREVGKAFFSFFGAEEPAEGNAETDPTVIDTEGKEHGKEEASQSKEESAENVRGASSKTP